MYTTKEQLINRTKELEKNTLIIWKSQDKKKITQNNKMIDRTMIRAINRMINKAIVCKERQIERQNDRTIDW